MGRHGYGSAQACVFLKSSKIWPALEAAGGGVALAFRISALDEPTVERFVEIIDVRGGEHVVTVINFSARPTKATDYTLSLISATNCWQAA